MEETSDNIWLTWRGNMVSWTDGTVAWHNYADNNSEDSWAIEWPLHGKNSTPAYWEILV